MVRTSILAATLGFAGCASPPISVVDGGGPDADPAEPDDDSFAGAIRIEIDGPATAGEIEPVDDYDLYVFQGEPGDWVQARANAETGEPGLMFYDPDQVRVGSVAGAFPTRLGVAGDHYVRVSGWTMDGSSNALGGPYELAVSRIVDGDGTAVESEAGDGPESAIPILPGSIEDQLRVFGGFDHPGDVDLFSFEHAGPEPARILVWATREGAFGHGSTTEVGYMWIADATGATVIGRAEGYNQEILATPLLDPGTYLIGIDRASSPVGDNDFYDLLVYTNAVTLEKETAATLGANDTIALAEFSGEVLPDSGTGLYAQIVMFLPPDDVDVFAFDVGAGERVDVSCVRGPGSGMGTVTADVRDAGDNVLASAVPHAWLEVAPGRYYVQVSASGHDPTNVGYYAGCIHR